MKTFYWKRRPEIESLFFHHLEMFTGKNSLLSDLAGKLHRRTSSGILNWVDHILAEDTFEIRRDLGALGFEQQESSQSTAFFHPGVMLPSVVLIRTTGSLDPGTALRVDHIEDFIKANSLHCDIEGPAFSPYRRALVGVQNGVSLWVVERRGTRAFDPVFPKESSIQQYTEAAAEWANLSRNEISEEQAWLDRNRVADGLVAEFGAGTAADIVCRCERDYWLTRNSAGQAQKKRQDSVGVGWANQDHHTFRSSRRNFSKLINLFIKLGFQKRERFYAGEEAGWGAQVMEHPSAGLSLFLDVDLTPEEVDIDFSDLELGELDTLGTVGLWCALHGDSLLEAGMHHLAARFDFERLIEDTRDKGIRFMPPFSNFPYLKQAFTQAEMWTVEPSRIRSLVQEKRIQEDQAEKFLDRGSVGSHLENIERREGYKGFNRKNVSAIIRDTDPRR